MAVTASNRAAVEASPTKATRRGPLNLLSAGHLVMIVAGLVGILLTLALLRSADQRVKVVVAARDVRTGDPIDTSTIRYERVRADDDLLETALGPGDVDDLDGSVATGPIGEGELISTSDLRRAATGSNLRAVSVPVDPARAVNGELAVGDRVDVVLVVEQQAATVVADVEVLDVSESPGGAFGEVQDQFSITLAVDADQAQLLAVAITDGDFLVARSTGAASAEGTPPLVVETLGTEPDSAGSR